MNYIAVYRNENDQKVQIGEGKTIKEAISDAQRTIKNEFLTIREFWVHKEHCYYASRHVEVA